MPANKLPNDYSRGISFYSKCPKAVFAAIAASYAQRLFGDGCDIDTELLKEWDTLNQNGIVPQKPKE